MIILGNLCSVDDEDLLAKYRLISLKTINSISLQLLNNIYTERMERKTCYFLDPLFIYFKD